MLRARCRGTCCRGGCGGLRCRKANRCRRRDSEDPEVEPHVRSDDMVRGSQDHLKASLTFAYGRHSADFDEDEEVATEFLGPAPEDETMLAAQI